MKAFNKLKLLMIHIENMKTQNKRILNVVM